MKHILIIATALLVGAQALAKPADFARGRVVDTSDESFVQRLTLPEDVYDWVTRDDLGDLRIFNGSQEEVPYALRRPETRDEYSPWQTMPLFPLPDTNVSRGGDSRVRVELDSGGTVISISGDSPAAGPVAGFLVDASSRTQKATEVRLDWDGQDAVDFVGRLRIEGSDDLDAWRTLIDATTIASLSSEGHTVRVDRIELSGTNHRYLKLTQLEGNDRIRLTRVQLRHRESQLPLRQWRVLEASAVGDGFEFETGGRYPLDRVTVQHAGKQTNFLVTAELFSRTEPEQGWRSRGTHTFYRTGINGLTAESDPLGVGHRDQYWRVEFEGEGLEAPVLKVGWLPDEIVFLKQGAAPYVLAYGQAGVEGRQWPVNQLLRQLRNGSEPVELGDIIAARLAAPEMLGGPSRLEPPAEPIDWRTIVLWAVLVLGVLVVGGFAYRLLKSS